MRPCLRLLAFSLLSCTLVAFAGEIHTFNCTNTNCNFKAVIFCGGGDAVAKVSGYCEHCGKIVTATFPHKERMGLGPHAVARIWDPATGKTLDVFACPTCKRPFAPVEKMNYCPKCGGKTMAEGAPGLWD
ncbi:MAG: hypothetical protein HZA88_14650 [Verrucomicrobia bacterium]|nr:hypothetical protein [Verrucomicrobiota bacterium]